MSYREIPMWTVDCDRCGVNADEGGDFVAWAEKDGAQESADGEGWLTTRDGEHYCSDCITWDDKTDDLVPLPPVGAS